jgi:hypothetical protein
MIASLVMLTLAVIAASRDSFGSRLFGGFIFFCLWMKGAAVLLGDPDMRDPHTFYIGIFAMLALDLIGGLIALVLSCRRWVRARR